MNVLFIHISIPKTNWLIWTLKLRVLKRASLKMFRALVIRKDKLREAEGKGRFKSREVLMTRKFCLVLLYIKLCRGYNFTCLNNNQTFFEI